MLIENKRDMLALQTGTIQPVANAPGDPGAGKFLCVAKQEALLLAELPPFVRVNANPETDKAGGGPDGHDKFLQYGIELCIVPALSLGNTEDASHVHVRQVVLDEQMTPKSSEARPDLINREISRDHHNSIVRGGLLAAVIKEAMEHGLDP